MDLHDGRWAGTVTDFADAELHAEAKAMAAEMAEGLDGNDLGLVLLALTYTMSFALGETPVADRTPYIDAIVRVLKAS